MNARTMTRTRSTVLAAGAVAALAAPLALGSPAQASTTSNGCVVTPVAPVEAGYENPPGVKIIDYRVIVTCQAGLKVNLWDERLEQDLAASGDPVDDFTGSSKHVVDFRGLPGPSTKSVQIRVQYPNADQGGDQFDELYHKVRFTVTDPLGTSPRTAWELTQASSIRQ